MSQVYLKVKIKSLADEARIIRHEERKSLNSGRFCKGKQGLQKESEKSYYLYRKLRDHRIGIVISEARASLIAYAFIRGKSFASLNEVKPDFKELTQIHGYYHNYTLWSRVGRLICKYGEVEFKNKDQKIIDNKAFTTINPEILKEWIEGKTMVNINNKLQENKQ